MNVKKRMGGLNEWKRVCRPEAIYVRLQEENFPVDSNVRGIDIDIA